MINTEKLFYSLGMVAGFVLVFLVCLFAHLLYRKKKGKSTNDYDERQKAIQGVAYKYSFFTVIAYYIANGLFCKLFGDWLDTMSMNFVGICLGLVVFAGYSIIKDAYVSLSGNLSRYIIVFLVVSAINFAGFFGNIITKGDDETFSVNLVCGVTLLIVSVIAIIKIIIDKKAEKREIEE